MLHLVMNVDDSKVYAHRFGSKIGINELHTRSQTRVHWVLTCIVSLEKTCLPVYFFRPKWNWFFSYFPFIFIWDFFQKAHKCRLAFHSGQHQGSADFQNWKIIHKVESEGHFRWDRLDSCCNISFYANFKRPHYIFAGIWIFKISKWKFKISTRDFRTTNGLDWHCIPRILREFEPN